MTDTELLESLRREVHAIDTITATLKEIPHLGRTEDDLRMAFYHLDEARTRLVRLHFTLTEED